MVSRARLKRDGTRAETRFGLSGKRTSPFKSAGGGQFSRLLAAEVCASAVVMVVMLDTPCSEVEWKTTGYPLHSPVSPSLPLPCVTVCHQVSSELYRKSGTGNSWLGLNGEPALPNVTVRCMLIQHWPGHKTGCCCTSLRPPPQPPPSTDLPQRTTESGIITERVATQGRRNLDELGKAVEEAFNTVMPRILQHVCHTARFSACLDTQRCTYGSTCYKVTLAKSGVKWGDDFLATLLCPLTRKFLKSMPINITVF